MAMRQHRETVVVPAARGTIVDRNGEPLAIGKQATTVFANPRQVESARDLTLALGKHLGADLATTYSLLSDRSRGFVYVARKANPERAEQLEKLDFAGLGFYPEELRFYPQGPVAAQVLGYAGLDNNGLEGLERSLDGTLSGVRAARPSSRTRSARTRRGRDEAGDTRQERQAHDRPSDPGEGRRGAPEHGLALGRPRRHCDRARSLLRRHPRDGDGTPVQHEPLPDDPRGSAQESRSHRHVRAGLDVQAGDGRRRPRGGIVTPRTSFLLPPTLKVADRTIREAHTRGTQRMTVRQIVEYSSNIGTITVANDSARAGLRRGSSASGSAPRPASTSRASQPVSRFRSSNGRAPRSAPFPSGTA